MDEDQKMKGALGCLVLVVTLGIVLSAPIQARIAVSDGVRIGTVTKASTNGLVFSTHEAGLAMESFKQVGDNGANSNLWEFSCEDGAVWAKIEAAAASGKKVRIAYRHTMGTVPWKGETSFFATGCEEVSGK